MTAYAPRNMRVIIAGAGIAGLATALSLTRWMSSQPHITILELRPSPSTMGGAIGLTPNALRALAALGVMDYITQKHLGASIDRIELFDIYTASRLGDISFSGPGGEGLGLPPFKGLRILRCDLLSALLNTVAQLNNITVEYGSTITNITESENLVAVDTKNRTSPRLADLLIGADGIHSFVRRCHVEPQRLPEYTGVAAVSGFAEMPPNTTVLPWKDTALSQALRGSLLCSYYELSRTRQFIAAVMETPDVKSKEGWIAMGKEQDDIKHRVQERYLEGSRKMGAISSLVRASNSWNLYPVYTLSSGGRWATARTILVGDAAHAASVDTSYHSTTT